MRRAESSPESAKCRVSLLEIRKIVAEICIFIKNIVCKELLINLKVAFLLTVMGCASSDFEVKVFNKSRNYFRNIITLCLSPALLGAFTRAKS